MAIWSGARDPSLRIKDVASDLGFSSPAYFSPWFQRLCVCSPTTHRQITRND